MEITREYKDFTVQKINSLKNINHIKNEWNFLHKSFDSKNIYTDPEFFKLMFSTRAPEGSKENVVLITKNGTPKALILGWITPNFRVTNWVGYYKFNSPNLNCLEIEINGLITDGTYEAEQYIFEYLRTLIKFREIDLFSFDHLSSKNPLWEKIVNGNGVHKKSIYKQSVNWVTSLKDFNTGKKRNIHSSKTNSKLLRKARKFENSFNNELQIKTINNEEEINFFIKNAEIISKNSYQSSIDVGITDNNYCKKMLTQLANGKYLQAYLLMNNETPIAYIYGAQYSNVLYLIGTSYDNRYSNYSPGEYLRHKLIDEFIEMGIDEIDYGFGDAVYKQRCGTECTEEASIRIYGNGVKALYSSFIDNFLTKTIENLIKILKNYGLLERIKFLWRQRLIRKTAIYQQN